MISDPEIDPDAVLIVNLTSFREDKDQACILNSGDHPFVKHQTCVNYQDAKIVKTSDLEMLLHNGKIKPHASLKADVLARIRDGAMRSTRIKLSRAQILLDQGLVDDS